MFIAQSRFHCGLYDIVSENDSTYYYMYTLCDIAYYLSHNIHAHFIQEKTFYIHNILSALALKEHPPIYIQISAIVIWKGG